MITLLEFINATTWLEPQDYVKVCLWDKSKTYSDEDGEFKDILLNVKNLAKYGNYYVSNIDIETDNNNYKTYLSCMICED